MRNCGTGNPGSNFHGLKIFAFSLLFLVLPTAELCAQAFNDFDLSPHDYYEGTADDAMTRLLVRAEAGDYDFGTETGLPLVKKLLAELDIPESSQILVFSQTSLQRGLIGPDNPRALYFNEDTHLAWMPGGKIEIISFDPETGGRFFIEDPPEETGEKVRFTSPNSCFGCHGGAATNFLPGPLARSHFTSETGRRLAAVKGHNRLGHSVPFENRWGGYFVTNAPETLPHLGNAFAYRNEKREVLIDGVKDRSKTTLGKYFDASLLPRGDSDLVPLLLFDHQIEAHNLIMEARYRHRHQEYQTAKFGKPVSRDLASNEAHFDRLVKYLLFADEVPLIGHQIEPNPEFESDFREGCKTTADGLSLKDLSLDGRIFEHRLSYMIQTRSFLESPQAMKNRVYDRLFTILTADDPGDEFGYFKTGERKRILRILQETHDDLPAEWTEKLASAR